ncbi:transmembrane protein 14C-like protein [Conidiobolus coronatus NRRL 28638]|uniref:Transmembrane protein 14C-like protein n=1 Tax=Conidiobolus coronatus (strain ATCC 28846 / CBS 209.66 / NRRL 28638) TaxID=796925 RepID=A0A137PB97_CONC2|nr:transmembrane protein 14C-like protein [Conidiobolus coronatus NRRL 28638]|eukprot:KXN72285.1 transmembrane protein 14C-like protein [Conidiobolus coronatus NRRL 28638]
MDYLGYVYAALLSIGGFVGYIKAGSVPSLVAGVGFGAAAGYAAARVSQNPKDSLFALVISVVLLIVMGVRYAKTQKFMPPGLLALLSLIMSVRYGKLFFQ